MNMNFTQENKKSKTLKGRLMRIFFTCVICMLLLSIVAISVFYQISMDNMSKVNAQLNKVAAINVEYSINVRAKEYIDLFISQSTSRVLNHIAKDKDKNYQYQIMYDEWKKDIATSAAWMPSFVHSIAVVDLNGDFHTWGRSIAKEKKSDILGLISANSISDVGDVQYFYVGEQGNKSLIAIRTLLNIDTFNLETVGYSFTVLDFDAIVKDGYVSHIDASNATVCGYLGDELIYLYPKQKIDEFSSAETNAMLQTIGNETYLLSETFLKDTEIRLCTFQNISQTQQVLLAVFVGCIVIILVGGILIALYNNHHITKLLLRLEILTKTINSIFKDNVYHNDVVIDLKPFSEPHIDELTTVAEAYKEAYDKTNELITENLMRKLLFQEQQFIFLQSQINPHFLYNTLDTIKVLSQDPSKSRTVSDLVKSLSFIMRYSLSRDMLSHVAEELQIVRQYMVIQRTRFSSRMRFSAMIEEGCEDIELPKMILQPLIENAIQYSTERKGDVSHIRLRIYTKSKNLYIAIIDTGIGLPENVLKCLQNREFNSLPGHGLKNVMIRMENIFKERFDVTVRTKTGKYTAIRLCVLEQTDFRDANIKDF